MSVMHFIAWGALDVTPENFKSFKRAVREELRTHRMSLIACGNRTFRLVSRRGDRPHHKGYRKYNICTGNFVTCCRAAVEIITPEVKSNAAR